MELIIWLAVTNIVLSIIGDVIYYKKIKELNNIIGSVVVIISTTVLIKFFYDNYDLVFISYMILMVIEGYTSIIVFKEFFKKITKLLKYKNNIKLENCLTCDSCGSLNFSTKSFICGNIGKNIKINPNNFKCPYYKETLNWYKINRLEQYDVNKKIEDDNKKDRIASEKYEIELNKKIKVIEKLEKECYSIDNIK